MKTIERLKKNARLSATFRDHNLSRFKNDNYGYWLAVCKKCNRRVMVTDKPLLNEINIHGEAVAVGCN